MSCFSHSRGATGFVSDIDTQLRLRTGRLISLAAFQVAGVRSGSRDYRQRKMACKSHADSFSFGPRTSMTNLSFGHETVAWDVLGIGQAMVDFAATVDDAFLEQLGVEKSGRRIITVEERAKILDLLDSNSYQINAGGSLANTLASLGRLGRADVASAKVFKKPLRLGAVSVVGSDALGSFHTAQQRKAGVTTLAQPLLNSATGTVIVLTTPDASRTFLSYLGTSQELDPPPEVTAAIRQSRLLALEGYLWEMPQAALGIRKMADLAHASGSVVALTAGDANVVERHHSEILDQLQRGVDIFFANRSEAEALLQKKCTAEEAALALGPLCSIVVVTDGANGSCISAMGRLQVVPPFWVSNKPVDTCGAGDAYAAGLLYGWLAGMDPLAMGKFGARVASAVISKHGGSLTADDASELVDTFSPPCPLDFYQAMKFSQ